MGRIGLVEFTLLLQDASHYFEIDDLNRIWHIIIQMDNYKYEEAKRNKITLYDSLGNAISAELIFSRETVFITIDEKVFTPNDYPGWSTDYIEASEVHNSMNSKYTKMALRFPFIYEYLKENDPENFDYYYGNTADE